MSKLLDRKQIANFLSVGQEKPWYRIENKTSDDVARLYIYDEISLWGITADALITELNEITSPQIDVCINCKGGDVFDGIAIFNALRQHPATVHTKVDSLAASIASVIAQSGDKRVMVRHSQMMIHEAQGIAMGSASEMKEMSDLLDRQSEVIAGIYADRAGDGRKKSHFRTLMRAETWMTDKEAIEEGLADEIEIPPTKNVAKDPVNLPFNSEEPEDTYKKQIDWHQFMKEISR